MLTLVSFFSGSASIVDNNQVVLNTGGDQYQTVTIVPSDGHTGEVNNNLAVIIVFQKNMINLFG
jgi:hypothetical protein